MMSAAERRARAAGDVRALIRSFAAVREQYGLEQIVDGSPAADEIAAWIGAGHESGALAEAFMSGLRATIAAEDLLETAAGVAAAPERAFSTLTLVRSSLEACAWAYWYLAPGLGPSERAGRALHQADLAVKATGRFFRKARMTPNDNLQEETARLEGFVDAEKARGVALVAPPNVEGRLRLLVDSLELPRQFADAGLDALSGVAHVEKHARDLLILGFDAKTGTVIRQPHPATEWVLWLGGWGYARAADSLAGTLGWESEMWVRSVTYFTERLYQHVAEVREERLG